MAYVALARTTGVGLQLRASSVCGLYTFEETPPHAELLGPARAVVGTPVHFDASASRDPQKRPLHFRWTAGEFALQLAQHRRLGLGIDECTA